MRAEFILPWSPSTNNLRGGNRFGHSYPKKGYTDWKKTAGDELDRLCMIEEPYEGRVSVTVRCYPPTKRPYDVDNRLKAVLDLLEKRVIVNDDQVDRCIGLRGHIHPGGAVWVIVESWDGGVIPRLPS